MELQVQGSRKRTEVAKIGKEPVSQRENAIEECLCELLEMAKTIGKREIHEFISKSLYIEYTFREITLVKVHLVRILINATIFIIKCERLLNSAKFMISKMQTQLISHTNVLLISTCFINIVNTKYNNIM